MPRCGRCFLVAQLVRMLAPSQFRIDTSSTHPIWLQQVMPLSPLSLVQP